MPPGAKPTSAQLLEPRKKGAIEVEVESKTVGTITVERSFTKNMGDFNSTRVSVSITLPINPTKEMLEDAQASVELVNQRCEKILEAELDKLQV